MPGLLRGWYFFGFSRKNQGLVKYKIIDPHIINLIDLYHSFVNI